MSCATSRKSSKLNGEVVSAEVCNGSSNSRPAENPVKMGGVERLRS
jgi:hypothetical protein